MNNFNPPPYVLEALARWEKDIALKAKEEERKEKDPVNKLPSN